MASDHMAAHTHTAIKGCWRAGCSRVGTEQSGDRFYCIAHINPRTTTPDLDQVLVARRLMSLSGGRLTLADAAGRLGLQVAALDQALWRNLGRKR